MFISKEWPIFLILGNSNADLTLADLEEKFPFDKSIGPKEQGDKFIHPDYNIERKNETYSRDIGLIRLRSPIKTSPLGQNAVENSMCLLEMSKIIDKKLNEYLMLVGWECLQTKSN